MLGVPVVQGAEPEPTPTRRNDVRREMSERIQLRRWSASATAVGAGKLLDGWALNVSRGGIRCILEEKVELGDEFELTIGEGSNAPLTRRGRIVWLRKKDGVIVGIEFRSLSGMHRFPGVVGAPPPERAGPRGRRRRRFVRAGGHLTAARAPLPFPGTLPSRLRPSIRLARAR